MTTFGSTVKSRFRKRMNELAPDFEEVKSSKYKGIKGRGYLRHLNNGRYGAVVLKLAAAKWELSCCVTQFETPDFNPDFCRVIFPSENYTSPGVAIPIGRFLANDMYDLWWNVCEEEFWKWRNYEPLAPGNCAFTPQQCTERIAASPALYPDELSEEEKLILPHVDDMMDMIEKYALPYLRAL